MKRARALLGAILVCLLFGGFTADAEMVVQACFSPQGKCSAHLIREIGAAKKELLVAVYAFTHDDLAAALVQARKRGVVVQVVVDRDFDRTNSTSKGKFLDTQKVPVRRISAAPTQKPENEPGLMHQKFAVIDRQIVFTGSYNWTYSADNRNDENLLIFQNAASLADEYRRIFLRLWERKP